MPIPGAPGVGGPPPRGPLAKDFHLPARQPWARDHERRHHAEALFGFGEWAMFVLLWNLEDLNAGRVGRCTRCRSTAGVTAENSAMIFDAFKAPAEDRCPNCLGTTFEGGWKAKIIRPALWHDGEEGEQDGSRGEYLSNSGSIQSTSDFHLRRGDYVLRGDGTRWQVSNAQVTRLIDGFATPSRTDSNLAVNMSQAVREDPTSVAFIIEPTSRDELQELLERVGGHFRTRYGDLDQVRGPILPDYNDHAPTDYRPYDNLPGSPEVDPWP